MKLLTFPQLRQTYPYDCGATVFQAILLYYGIDIRKDKIIRQLGTNQKSGTHPGSLCKSMRTHKLSYDAKPMTIDTLKKYIHKGIPVILVLQAWTKKRNPNWKKIWNDGHYVVAIGYDKNKIIFEDPTMFSRTFLTNAELEQRWHDIDTQGTIFDHYGIAVYGPKPISRTQIIHMN